MFVTNKLGSITVSATYD